MKCRIFTDGRRQASPHENIKPQLKKEEKDADRLVSQTKFRNEMLDMLDGNDDDVNDEKQMEAYINNVNIANISDVEESIEDEKKGLVTQKQIRIQSKSTKTIQSTSSSDEDNNDNSSSEDDTFIVHSTEEALKRIHENGIQKKKKNESEDLFSALFAWCATERDEDM